jgi:membrane protein YdbS with pleckstrin-like domain
MFFLPQPWAWDKRQGRNLPPEFLRYLSDPELNNPALGGQIHWSVMIEPVFTTVAGLFICFWLISILPSDVVILGELLVLAILLLIGRLALKYYLWYRELVFITTKRVITVSGIITRRVNMMPLGKLTDMNYTRTPMGMILGYGSFRFESAGQNQAIELLGRIPNPDDSYRYVQNLLFGRGTTDVILVDVKTDKKVNVNWRGRIFPSGKGGGASLEPADDEEWYDK